MRWTAAVHVAALALQMVFALAFLSGAAQGFDAHRTCAWLVLALGTLQFAAALALGVTCAGKWLCAATFAVAVLEALQIHLGQTAQTQAHVLLAMLLWGLSLAVLIRVWGPGWGMQQTRRAS